MTKLKVGFYGITGCAGCQLSVIFQEDDLLDLLELVEIRAWPFIKDVNDDETFDYVFMEGLVATNEDKERLLKIRKNTKILIALGACAHTGCVPAYRHFTLQKNYAHLLYEKNKNISDVQPSPIDSFVQVDYVIPGCPPSKQEIRTFLKTVVLGNIPKSYDNPVCTECKLHNNGCLLEVKKPCLGPITRGGCNAICINGGLECWGCRGPTDDANLPVMVTILRKQGHGLKFIKDRLVTFAGTKMPAVRKLVYDKNNKA
ncbi:MAG: hypothetical protein KKA90_03450 [Nanoarchaeota archaeon]|nr:hypothetical protein [Nanoarchaeota archaeon]